MNGAKFSLDFSRYHTNLLVTVAALRRLIYQSDDSFLIYSHRFLIPLKGVCAIVILIGRTAESHMRQPLQLFYANDECPPTPLHFCEREDAIKLER